MQSKYIRNDGNQRLILIFAGWGMDWRPFRSLSKPGYDIMVIWDYRQLTFNWQPLLSYREICILAWSMGVFAASLTIHEILPRVTKRIAVNGTLEPIHPTRGISPDIFAGTLAGMSPTNLRKFYRRMCANPEQFAMFMADKPRRTIEELIDELAAIEQHTIFHAPQVTEWDLAVISRDDAIFGMNNMLAAWRGNTPVRLMEAAHLPDFKLLLARLFIDKERVITRFTDTTGSYGDNDAAQRTAATALMDFARQCGMPDPNGNILEIGAGSGNLTRLYAPQHREGTIRLWDIASVRQDTIYPNAVTEICDAEMQIRRIPAASIDFILSASTIQWFNSPSNFLRQCRRVLAPQGWVAISTFIHGNLPELTPLVGSGLNLPTAEGWLGMLTPEFENVESATRTIILHFDSPREVLRHMRDTGVNAVDYGRSNTVLARRILDNLTPGPDGRYTLTYKAILLVANNITT